MFYHVIYPRFLCKLKYQAQIIEHIPHTSHSKCDICSNRCELREKSFHYVLEAGRRLFGSGYDTIILGCTILCDTIDITLTCMYM